MSDSERSSIMPLMILALLFALVAGYFMVLQGQGPGARRTTTTTAKPTFPLSLTDDAGHAVTINAPPARIVSLSPSVTEILFALGLGDRVVGVDIDSDFPAGVSSIARVGTEETPDLAAIANAAPNAVFTSSSTDAASLIRQHAALLVFKVADLDSSYRAIERIGLVTQRDRIAGDLIKSLKAREKAAVGSVGAKATVDVYTEVAPGTRFDAENLDFYFGLLKLVRGRNIFPDQEISEGETPAEILTPLRPGVILILDPSATESEVRARSGWSRMLQQTGARLIVSAEDPNIFFRPGPRVIEGLERLREYVQPSGIGVPQ